MQSRIGFLEPFIQTHVVFYNSKSLRIAVNDLRNDLHSVRIVIFVPKMQTPQ